MTLDRFLNISLLVISFLLVMIGMAWGFQGEYPRASYLMVFAVYLRLMATGK